MPHDLRHIRECADNSRILLLHSLPTWECRGGWLLDVLHHFQKLCRQKEIRKKSIFQSNSAPSHWLERHLLLEEKNEIDEEEEIVSNYTDTRYSSSVAQDTRLDKTVSNHTGGQGKTDTHTSIMVQNPIWFPLHTEFTVVK